MPQIKPVMTLITPEMAREIYEGHKNTNITDRKKLDKFTMLMNEGRWTSRRSMPIIIKKGLLVDGNHRLLAMIHSGKSYEMPVLYV